MSLKTYQYELPGFDGSTDETDHLVRWVAAPNKAAADAYAKKKGWLPAGGEIYSAANTRALLAQDGSGGIDVVLL